MKKTLVSIALAIAAVAAHAETTYDLGVAGCTNAGYINCSSIPNSANLPMTFHWNMADSSTVLTVGPTIYTGATHAEPVVIVNSRLRTQSFTSYLTPTAKLTGQIVSTCACQGKGGFTWRHSYHFDTLTIN